MQHPKMDWSHSKNVKRELTVHWSISICSPVKCMNKEINLN